MSLDSILLPQLNVTGLINQTRFEQVQTISGDPYYITGFVLIIGFAIVMYLLFGMTHITQKKICFQSWIHNRYLIVIILQAIIMLWWFYSPLHFAWLGG